MQDSCKDCIYFCKSSNVPEYEGYCNRYPPIPIHTDDGEVITAWPAVFEHESCGEFKQKELKVGE